MFKFVFGIIIVFAFLFLPHLTEGTSNIKEGLWEITSQIEVPGMPMDMPAQTFRHCITKKDTVPYKAETGEECKMVRYDQMGNTVTWTMECKTKEGIVITKGKITYRGDFFDGIVKVKQGDMEMTQKMRGKWIGQCRQTKKVVIFNFIPHIMTLQN